MDDFSRQSLGEATTAEAFVLRKEDLGSVNAQVPDIDSSGPGEATQPKDSESQLLPYPPPQRGKTSLPHLPPELLREIFFLCLPEDFCVAIPYNHDSKREFLPWKLGHVCSRWREIVWSSSLLWNHIVMVPESSHNDRFSEMADTVFRLAGERLVLDLSTEGSSYDFNPIHAYVEPNLARFMYLKLMLSPPLAIDLFSISKGSFDALEWFGLAIVGELDKMEVSRASAVAFRTASQLRKLKFFPKFVSDIPFLIKMQFPWSQITHLSLTSPEIRPCDALSLLIQCSELTTCCFLYIERDSGTDSETALQVGSIFLPKLDFLDMEITDGTPADAILAFLVLPSLSKLGLASTNAGDSVALTRLFTRSSCPLQILKLEGCFHDLGPILASVPFLKFLHGPEGYLRPAWMHILPAQLFSFTCCVTREDAFTFLEIFETKLQTWMTSAEVGVENADDDLIRTLNLKLADLKMRYGLLDWVEFIKLEIRP